MHHIYTQDIHINILMKALAIALLATLATMELVNVIEIAVPGASSPNLDLPPGEFYNEGLNELTPIGIRQHYLLGYYHKQTWAKAFLDADYNEHQVYVKSINTNSSIMSCYAHTIGLYKAVPHEKLNTNQIKMARPPIANDSNFNYLEKMLDVYPLPYMMYPIPTHVFNPEIDPLAADICPKANRRISDEYLASTEVDQLIKDYSAVLDDVKNTYKLSDMYASKLFLPEVVADIMAADFDTRPLGLHPATIAGVRELSSKIASYAYCGATASDACKLLAHNFNAYIIDIVDDIVYDYSHVLKEKRRSYTLLMTSERMFAALLKSWGYKIDKAIPPASFILISVARSDEDTEKEAKDFKVTITLSTEKNKAPTPMPICPNGQCTLPVFLDNSNKALINTKNITKDCSL